MIDCSTEYALQCSQLCQDFYLINEQHSWRIIFRDSEHIKTYPVLKNIELVVPKGKFVGVLGRNGAGKSTLLRILAGVYPIQKGILKTNGRISALFELGGFGNNRLTGYAYARRYLEIYGVKKEQIAKLILKIKDFSELKEAFDKPIYTYSAGMSARLFFSTATELQHEIYLVDELLSVGDAHFQAKCWKRLRQRFSSGASGILVTHDWSAIIKLCQSAYILDNGAMIAYGNTEQIVNHYLNLPVPSKKYVEIIPNVSYLLESNQNSKITFGILVKKSLMLSLNYSIEIFRSGFGWELMMLNEKYLPLEVKQGANTCEIIIPQLPLVEGEYYLNIFLKSTDNSIDPIELDACSWTYGNGIKLIVKGNPSRAVTCLPWTKIVDSKVC